MSIFPVVGGAPTNGYHPAVITLTYPAVGILLAVNDTITQLLASDVDTTGAQTAPPPHHTHPLAVPLPAAVQAAVIVTGVLDTAGGDEFDIKNTIVTLDGTGSRMIG